MVKVGRKSDLEQLDRFATAARVKINRAIPQRDKRGIREWMNSRDVQITKADLIRACRKRGLAISASATRDQAIDTLVCNWGVIGAKLKLPDPNPKKRKAPARRKRKKK